MVQLFRFRVQSLSVGKYYREDAMEISRKQVLVVSKLFTRPQTKLREGYVFRGLCLSTGDGGRVPSGGGANILSRRGYLP